MATGDLSKGIYHIYGHPLGLEGDMDSQEDEEEREEKEEKERKEREEREEKERKERETVDSSTVFADGRVNRQTAATAGKTSTETATEQANGKNKEIGDRTGAHSPKGKRSGVPGTSGHAVKSDASPECEEGEEREDSDNSITASISSSHMFVADKVDSSTVAMVAETALVEAEEGTGATAAQANSASDHIEAGSKAVAAKVGENGQTDGRTDAPSVSPLADQSQEDGEEPDVAEDHAAPTEPTAATAPTTPTALIEETKKSSGSTCEAKDANEASGKRIIETDTSPAGKRAKRN